MGKTPAFPGPILKEPPLAHASDHWDEASRTLTYTYNGRYLIRMTIPGEQEPGYRRTSDGDLQGAPFYQQLYFTSETPVSVDVQFEVSAEAVNMRPNRADAGMAIRGQLGRPLTPEINGIYDIGQDLLVEWHGADWKWLGNALTATADGGLTATLRVTLTQMPWFMNIKPHYYRMHLGYDYYRPWERRPNPQPVAGWCSWEAHRRDVTADHVKAAAEFMSNTFGPYGARYLQLDDGYEHMPVPHQDTTPMCESWLVTNRQFPDGHEGIVKTITEKGLEPGIWTCSAIINDAFAQHFSTNMLKDPEGNLITGKWAGYLLDCCPETLATHVVPLYERLRELGYTYLKIDGIRHLLYDGLQQAVITGAITNDDAEKRFRAYMEAVRKGLGDDVYLLSSWGVLSQVVGVADACRISMDANPTWAGVRMQLVESARCWHAQRILFVNDPDHICARATLEWTRSVCSLVSLTGGLFMMSDPLDAYDAPRIDVIRKCLPPLEAVAGETGPLDTAYPAFTWTKLHGFAVPRENVVAAEDVTLDDALNMAGQYPTMNEDHPFSSLWAFHMNAANREWHVVGRFATVPLRASKIPLDAVGATPGRRYHLFDFWKQEYRGTVDQQIACEGLDIGRCEILALIPDLGRPQFIASSRHVSMGAVELADESWDGTTLHLALNGIPGTTQTCWFAVPKACAVSQITAHGADAGFCYAQGLIKVDTVFDSPSVALKIRFGLKTG